jgi:threonine/homoserine/homoserine lactone efflux protein
MSELTLFLRGVVIGFSLAVPVGPVGILCIRRTLAHGDKRGFFTGLAAASADAIYGAVAAFGVTLVSDFITAELVWFRLLGGIMLIALGLRTYRSHPERDPAPSNGSNHTGIFVSTFILTLTNPMSVFAFAAVFAGLGSAVIGHTTIDRFSLVAGVFLGSFLWFGLLTTIVHIFKEKIQTDGIILINKIAGGIIMFFGAVAFLSLLVR